jgi:nucleoside-diphosphate-sugar epimerase
MLARAFAPYAESPDVLVFASGVSNSREVSTDAFTREGRLLRESATRYPDATFVYFSTCSVLDEELRSAPYVQHKLAMEALTSTRPRFYVFRLPLVVGYSDNPHTLMNFFYHRILRELPIPVWDGAERNLIDVQDVYAIASRIIDRRLMENQIINIAAPQNISITDIVTTMAAVTGKAPNVVHEKGHQRSRYAIDISAIKPTVDDLKLAFDECYLESTLRKYYGQSVLACT